MRNVTYVAGLVLVCCLCGCRKPAPAPGGMSASDADDLKARLARLELNQSRLADRIDNLLAMQESKLASAPSGAVTSVAVTTAQGDAIDPLQPLLETKVKEIVEGSLNERIGDRQTIQAVFEDVVEEEIAAREERKRKEAEEAAQVRREAREQERVEREEKEMATFAEVLGLNESQVDAVKAISEQTRDAMRQTFSEMREDGRYTPKDYRVAMDMIRSNQNEAVRVTLSDEQYKLFMEEYDGRIRGFGGRGFFGSGGRGRP